MSESETKVRVCQACGKDCSGQPRIKDKKGRYLHKACYEKALAKANAARPEARCTRPTVGGRRRAAGGQGKLGVVRVMPQSRQPPFRHRSVNASPPRALSVAPRRQAVQCLRR